MKSLALFAKTPDIKLRNFSRLAIDRLPCGQYTASQAEIRFCYPHYLQGGFFFPFDPLPTVCLAFLCALFNDDRRAAPLAQWRGPAERRLFISSGRCSPNVPTARFFVVSEAFMVGASHRDPNQTMRDEARSSQISPSARHQQRRRHETPTPAAHHPRRDCD